MYRIGTGNDLSLKQVGASFLIPCNGFFDERLVESRSQIPFHNEDNDVRPMFLLVLFLEL